jgi:hypothetical protein
MCSTLGIFYMEWEHELAVRAPLSSTRQVMENEKEKDS